MTTANLDTLGRPVFDKDPTDNLTYGLGWSAWLPTGVTVSSATWAADTGITVVSSAVSVGSETWDGVTYGAGQLTKVRLSGGTAGTTYTVTCSATLSTAETVQRSIRVRVRDV